MSGKRTRSTISIQGALIGFGVEDSVGVDREGALYFVQECDIDCIAHSSPEDRPQISQIGILSCPLLHVPWRCQLVSAGGCSGL